MNCDQVFDVLTRTSFHAAETAHDGVELHIRACHECRQLAEALRPAINLIHEAMPAWERDELPAYHGKSAVGGDRDLPGLIAAMIDETSREESECEATSLPVPASRMVTATPLDSTWNWWGQVTAGCIATLAVGFICWSLAAPGERREADRVAPAGIGPALLPQFVSAEPHVLAHIERLKLPDVCLSKAGESLVARVACCTNCHAAAIAETPSLTTLAAAWDTCSLCHTALGECF